MQLSELLGNTLKSINNSLDRTPKKSSTQFRKLDYTCGSIFQITYKEEKTTPHTHTHTHTYIYIYIYIYVNVFLSYLSRCLLLLRWSKRYLRSEMLLRTQSFIYKSCLYHEYLLRLFSQNYTQFNRQHYLFSLSKTVISFYKILRNILHVGVLRITQKK